MSSCYLLDSPQDELDSIYDRYTRSPGSRSTPAASGSSYSRVRSRGSLIRGTNGHSNGIVPFLRTLDASVAAVNQGGRRKGAACVYLETWHADIEEFLELRDNTGEDARRTHNLNLAHWVPGRVHAPGRGRRDLVAVRPRRGAPSWSTCGATSSTPPTATAEADGPLRAKQVPARDLYGRMMRTLAQTGNGWMTFKDAVQPHLQPDRRARRTVVHLSNLCTEILEVAGDGETAVCNLGSVNLGAHRRRRRRRDRLGAPDEHRPHGGAASSTASSTSTSTRPSRPALQPALAPGRPRA